MEKYFCATVVLYWMFSIHTHQDTPLIVCRGLQLWPFLDQPTGNTDWLNYKSLILSNVFPLAKQGSRIPCAGKSGKVEFYV